jgi:hypothetical protein
MKKSVSTLNMRNKNNDLDEKISFILKNDSQNNSLNNSLNSVEDKSIDEKSS